VDRAGIVARETSRAKSRFNRGAKRRSIRNRGTGRSQKTTTSAKATRNNALQGAFWRNQRDTVRTITDGEKGEVKCRISPQVLEERFRTDLQKPSANTALESLPDWISINPNVCNASAGASAEDLPILPREVEAVLRTLNAASAPGGDGLSYGFLKALDPRGEILAELFEICRTSRRVPDQWRTSSHPDLQKS